MNLGENIYHYRTQKNLSQGDLADALEVSRQSVSKWENNSATPELEKLMKMAQIFDITIDELVTGEDREAPTPPPAPEPAPLSATPGPVPTPAAKEGLSAQQILGIILLTCGLLAAIILFAVGFFTGAYIWSLVIGLPLVVLGTCCLLVKRHALLTCGWVLYISTIFLLTLLSRNDEMLVTCLLLAFGAILSIGSLVAVWSRKNQASLFAKILITFLIVVVMLYSLVPFLSVSTIDSTTSEETHTVAASAVPN